MKNKIAILTLSLLGLYQPAQAITLIGWDIPTSATAPTGTTVLAGMSVATGVTAGNFTMGNGLGTGSSTSAWRVNGYDQTGTDIAALTAANTAGDYWAFQFGASSGYSVTVNGIGAGTWSTSNSGPAKMSMIYSTSSDFASYSIIATATATAGTTFNFASSFTTELANAPITIAEGATGFFRLVGYGGTASNGTGGLIGNLTAPDFSILGSITSLGLLSWTGGAGEWANGVAANWQNAEGTPTAWGAGKDGTIGNGGTLAVDAGGVTAGVVTFSGATEATLTGGAVSAGSLAMTAGSTLNLNNANSAVSGSVDLTDATLSGGAVSSAGGISATVSTGTKTISTTLSGASGLTKSGAGELILSGDNTYAGQTAVAAGTLTTGKANILSDTATLKLDNLATLKLGGNETVGNINAAFGSTNNLQGFTLTSGGNNLSSTNGALTTGSGGLIKNGTGEMYLNQKSNNYTGGFTLNEGEVRFTSSGDQAAGILTNSVFGLGTLALNGGTIGSSSTSSGRNIYNSITLNNTVQVGNSAAFAALTTNANSGTAFLIFSTNTSGTTTLLGNTTLNTVGQTLWEQNISGSEYRLTKGGTGALAISNNYLQLRGSNNIAGVTVNSGILGYKNRNALGTGTLILADGVVVGQDGSINNIATADKDADRTVANNISVLGNVTFGLAATANYLSGNIDLNNATRTLTLQNATYLYGSIANGGLVVQRVETDLLNTKMFALYGSSTYGGGTMLIGVADRTNNVTLGLGNDSALGTGSLSFSGGGTNLLRALTLITTDLNRTITNNIAINSGVTVSVETMSSLTTVEAGTAVTNNVSVNMALNGVISGGGALIKTNSNTLTLGGANTYAGGTTVSGGTLIGTTSSLQGAITNNSAVIFNQSTSGSYTGVMSGTGTLTKTNSGTLTLSGNNTYLGGTTVSAGTLLAITNNISASITSNTIVITFSNVPANGTYAVLPSALTGRYTATYENLGSKTATFSTASPASVTVSSAGSTFDSVGFVAGTEGTIAANGLSNLMNYALGQNGPNAPFPAAPVHSTANGQITLTATARTDDSSLKFFGQWTTDLLLNDWELEGHSTELTPPGLSFSQTIDPNEPKIFIRFKIEKQ